MDAERNDRIKQLCLDAGELAPNERAAFLSQACMGDDELRREVESLLPFDETGTGFFDHTAWKHVAGEMVHEDTTVLLDKTVGHYRIQSLLGEGGMGKVYLALDTKLGRQVAIKFLPLPFTSEAERVRRFEQEARAASALNHPNIITMHEIGQAQTEAEGWHYIVMEHVAGQTLRTRLQAGKLTHEEAIGITAQVAAALAAAHHAGIVHRDIKPENIMLRDDGKVKVLDFGIAKLGEERGRDWGMGRGGDGEKETSAFRNSPTLPIPLSPTLPLSTAIGSVVGTVNYMSPEQARGEPLNGQSDVFSLGQILWEMVTGKSLFAGKEANAVLQLLRGEQEPLAEGYKFVGVPKALEAIIRKSLQRDVAARYETAQQMLVDLKTLQRRAATKWLRRGVLGGVYGVLLLLLALALAAWFSVNETWPEKLLRAGHTATVMQAVFAPDGKRLVSVSRDHHVIVWDFVRREQIKRLAAHQDAVNSVAFSPDGKWFATGSSDKTVIVWDAATLQPVATLYEHRDKVMAVAFSPDSKWLASASGSDTGGREDFRTVLWGVNGWRKVRDLPEGRSYGNLLFSPDSRFLKTQSEQWEVATGNQVTKDGEGIGVNWNVFAPGAKQLLAVAAGGVDLYQLAQAGQLSGRRQDVTFTGDRSPHQDFVRAAAYSPDGKVLATGANDIVLWGATTMEIQGRLSFESAVFNVTFSPDGRWLVSTHGDGTILVWNLAQRCREFSFNGPAEAVRTVAVSPDGKRYASAGDDRAIIIWNAETGGQEAVLAKHTTRVTNLAFSSDGQWLASLDQQGKLKRWDMRQRSFVWEADAINGTSCLALSPDGRWLVTHQVVLDADTGQAAFRLPNQSLETAAFSADGKWLAGLEGNQLLLIDWQNKHIVARETNGSAPLVAVQFSPDGATLATGSRDGALWFWEAVTLRPLGLLGKHEGQVSSINFSLDGTFLASAGADKTVKLWDVPAQKLLREVGIHAAPVAAVAFASGATLLTGEQDRSVRVYTRQQMLWGWKLKD